MRSHTTPHAAPLPSRGRGFTLIELLVVVSIIAILIGILLPAMQKAMDTAYAIQCKSNMREIGRASLLYAEDFDGWHYANSIWHDYEVPDEVRSHDGPVTDSRTVHWSAWWDAMGYMRPGPEAPEGYYNKVYRCPARHSMGSDASLISNPANRMVFMSGIGMIQRRSAYAMAGRHDIPWRRLEGEFTGSGTPNGWDPRFLRITYAPRPSESFLFLDNWNVDSTRGGDSCAWFGGYAGQNNNQAGVQIRHPGETANSWFMDGHVSTVGKTELDEMGFTKIRDADRNIIDF